MRPSALAALVSSGVPYPLALEELGANDFSDQLIELAISVGAPLVPTLKTLEQQLIHKERSESELQQAQAVPKATRKLLLWLPVLTLLISQLAGLQTLQGLLQPLGIVAAAFAAGLIYLGARVSAKMLRRLAKPTESEARELIALKICLSAGMGLHQIQGELPQLSAETLALIQLSQRTGASLTGLLESEIAASNERVISNQLTQAKNLSVALLIPLSATALPAFLLLTIVPMIIGITK
jgi:tight adherence protein B